MNVRKEDWMAKKPKNIPHTTAKAKQGTLQRTMTN